MGLDESFSLNNNILLEELPPEELIRRYKEADNAPDKISAHQIALAYENMGETAQKDFQDKLFQSFPYEKKQQNHTLYSALYGTEPGRRLIDSMFNNFQYHDLVLGYLGYDAERNITLPSIVATYEGIEPTERGAFEKFLLKQYPCTNRKLFEIYRGLLKTTAGSGFVKAYLPNISYLEEQFATEPELYDDFIEYLETHFKGHGSLQRMLGEKENLDYLKDLAEIQFPKFIIERGERLDEGTVETKSSVKK